MTDLRTPSATSPAAWVWRSWCGTAPLDPGRGGGLPGERSDVCLVAFRSQAQTLPEPCPPYRASDPWVSYSPDGKTVYQATLAFNANGPAFGGASSVQVSTSS